MAGKKQAIENTKKVAGNAKKAAAAQAKADAENAKKAAAEAAEWAKGAKSNDKKFVCPGSILSSLLIQTTTQGSRGS
jgi:hypothetical protein